jgi:hypothetical protein
MGIHSWFKNRRARGDEAARKQAEEEALETPNERAISASSREGLAADQWGARRAGMGSSSDVNRLGDF